jgi:ubiquinone/menaquinone biosynthesis C-methylase UbiE
MKNKEFWNEYAGAKLYATLMPYISHHRSLLERTLSLVEPYQTIGDFACGAGLLTSKLLEKNKEVIAVDHSAAMLEYVLDSYLKTQEDKNIPESHYHNNIYTSPEKNFSVYKSDIAELPLANNSVEAAVCLLALYNTSQPAKIVKELVRVSSDTVIVSSFNRQFNAEQLLESVEADFLREQLYPLYGAQIMDFVSGNLEVINQHMPSLMSSDEISYLLLDAGCHSIEVNEQTYSGNGFLVSGKK